MTIDQTRRNRLSIFEVPKANRAAVIATNGSLAIGQDTKRGQSNVITSVHDTHLTLARTTDLKHVKVAIGSGEKEHISLSMPAHLLDVRVDFMRPQKRLVRDVVDSSSSAHIAHGHKSPIMVEAHLGDRVRELLSLELALGRFRLIRRVIGEYITEIVFAARCEPILEDVYAKHGAFVFLDLLNRLVRLFIFVVVLVHFLRFFYSDITEVLR